MHERRKKKRSILFKSKDNYVTFSMVPKRDLFLISLALRRGLPRPNCQSNADLLVGPRGRSDLLSTKLVPIPLDGLSHWSPSLIILLLFRRFDTLNSFFAGASLPESEPNSANFRSNSSEDFLLTCWTWAGSIIERERNGW